MNYILPEGFDFYTELKNESEGLEKCHMTITVSIVESNLQSRIPCV